MKKTLIILLITLVFATVQAQTDNPLKQGMPNTTILPNGEVIYDLTGEWDAVIDNGYLGVDKDVIKITQEGNKFVGIKLIGNRWIGKDQEFIKGELEKDSIKSPYRNVYGHGWKPSNTEILDGGNKIVYEQELIKDNLPSRITLIRKKF